jgi:hypothetical protein
MPRYDGSGLAYTVWSGTGDCIAVVHHPPTPFGRIVLSTAPTITISAQILERRAPA